MPAGRPPKPTNLKILQGKPGHRPLPEGEPKPREVAPECPAWLPDEAKKKWAELAPELERIGLLTCIDGMAFTLLVVSWAEAVSVIKALKNNKGPMVRGQKGNKVKHPANQLLRDYAMLINMFGGQFGLTPSMRAKLSLPKVDDDDDLDDFLRSK